MHVWYNSDIISCFAHEAFYLNVIAIRQLQAISTCIIDITISNYQIITACAYCHATQLNVYISALEACIFITSVIIQVLHILQHAGICPVIINHAVNPDAGTDICCMVRFIAPNFIRLNMIRFCHCTVLVNITETNFTSNLYVVSLFLQVSYAHAQIFQLVSKFCCQSFYASALSHCFGNDLCHFIASHQLVATEGAVAIAIDYACSCQLADAVICPVAGRNIAERVSSVSRSGYTKSHCHCEY